MPNNKHDFLENLTTFHWRRSMVLPHMWKAHFSLWLLCSVSSREAKQQFVIQTEAVHNGTDKSCFQTCTATLNFTWNFLEEPHVWAQMSKLVELNFKKASPSQRPCGWPLVRAKWTAWAHGLCAHIVLLVGMNLQLHFFPLLLLVLSCSYTCSTLQCHHVTPCLLPVVSRGVTILHIIGSVQTLIFEPQFGYDLEG